MLLIAIWAVVLSSLFYVCSGGGSRGPDSVPDERGGEAADAVQSQGPAACRAQQEELHPGGRAQEATARQPGTPGLPTKYKYILPSVISAHMLAPSLSLSLHLYLRILLPHHMLGLSCLVHHI